MRSRKEARIMDTPGNASRILRSSTTLPPEEPPCELLATLLADEAVILVDSDGEHLKLPAEVVTVLRDAVTAMANEKAVTVVPEEQCLDTRQAADFLNCQHSTLLRLLDEGEIPCKAVDPPPFEERRGNRRILLADLLDFLERQAVRTREGIVELVRIGEECNLYELTADDPGPLR